MAAQPSRRQPRPSTRPTMEVEGAETAVLGRDGYPVELIDPQLPPRQGARADELEPRPRSGGGVVLWYVREPRTG
eukprot:11178383-Lingulodinium_polyedra.AAC.1